MPSVYFVLVRYKVWWVTSDVYKHWMRLYAKQRIYKFDKSILCIGYGWRYDGKAKMRFATFVNFSI